MANYAVPKKVLKPRRSGDGEIAVLNGDYVSPQFPVNDRRWTGAKGFKLEIYYTDGATSTKLDVTEMVMSISWSDSLDQAAAGGSIELYDPIDPITKQRRLLNINKGNRVKISIINDDNKMEELGRYVIWEKVRKSRTDATLSLTIKDMLIYLHQSEDVWLFQKDSKKKSVHRKGWTAAQITKYVCKRYSIPLDVQHLPKCTYYIPLVRMDSGSVYELLLKVWTEERKKTGNKFIIRCEGDKLKVIRKREQVVLHAAQEGQNIISSTFTDSLQGMYNAVTIVAEPASNKTSGSQQSTNRTTSATDTTRSDVYQSSGGGWKEGVASFFTPSGESTLAYGHPNSDDLMGWGEAANNTAMGGLAGKTMIEVRYNGKTLQLPKVDNGAGGSGIGSIPRVMDLTVAAWNALGIDQAEGKVVVSWRKLNSTGTTAASTKAVSGILATVKNQAKIDKYGYLHKTIKLKSGITRADAKSQALQIIRSTLSENLDGSVTCFLMPRLRAGAPIFVKDDGARLVGKFYCSQVSHTIAASGSTTTIDLNWLDMVPSALLTDEDKGIKPPPSGNTSCAQEAINAGRKYIGTPYSWGGGDSSGPTRGIPRSNGPSGANIVGFDCSGFVQYCWAKAGVSVPRHTDALAQIGQPVPVGQEQIGDILLYSTSDGTNAKYGHTALCSGPGMILNSGGGAGGGVREYARSDHTLVRRVSHLCPKKKTGGGGGGPFTPPTSDPAEVTYIMYVPHDKSNLKGGPKFPERETPDGEARVRTNKFTTDKFVWIKYNNKVARAVPVLSFDIPTGIQYVVGTEVAAKLGILSKPFQKFAADDIFLSNIVDNLTPF